MTHRTLIVCLFAVTPWLSADAGITTPSGLELEVVMTGAPLVGVQSLAASSDGHLYVCDAGTDTIHDVDLSTGNVTSLLSGFPLDGPDQMIIGDGSTLVGTDLVLADHNSHGDGFCCAGSVMRIDRTTGAVTVLTVGNPSHPTGDPSGLALGAGAFGSDLYVLDFEGSSPNPPVLFRIDQSGVASTFVIDAGQWTVDRNPFSLALDPNGAFGGDLFAVDGVDSSNPNGPAILWRVTPAGGLSPFAHSAALDRPTYIAFGKGGAFGTDMYVLDVGPSSSRVVRIDPTGVASSFLTGLPGAQNFTGGLAFSPDGSSLFVATQTEVLRLSGSSAWADLGSSLAGVSPAPCLLGQGTLVGGTIVGLHLRGAPPSSSTGLVIGASAINAPFEGGLLVPNPNVLLLGLPVDGAGRLSLAAPWPAVAPSGVSIYFQHWMLDPLGPGYVASNALRATTP